jgi:hypothetical protein
MKGLVSRLVMPITRVWFTSPYIGLGARGPQLRNFFNTLVVSERVEKFSVSLVRTSGQILGLRPLRGVSDSVVPPVRLGWGKCSATTDPEALRPERVLVT